MTGLSKSSQKTVLLIGSDDRLTYLLQRYFDLVSCHVEVSPGGSVFMYFEQVIPSLVVFSTIEELINNLENAKRFSVSGIPIMVCTSVADQAQALELGADSCLLHPITIENFKLALKGISVFEVDLSGL